MKMVTTCPACGTAFRIHRNQIDARGGQVRCGHCTVVFDAHTHLQVEAELPPPMDDPSPEHDTAIIPITALQEEPPPSVQSEDIPAPDMEPMEPGKSAAEELEPPTLEELGFPLRPTPRTAARRRLWGTLALLFALALIAQLLYHFRGQVALYVPAAEPLLQQACMQIGCTLPLPRRAELVSIEANEMQFDPAKSAVLTLSAVLRNRAAFDQAYPAIELTLTDETQTTISRRILQPIEYLDEGLKKTVAFAANSEVAIKLYIDATDLNASSYRMEIFYL